MLSWEYPPVIVGGLGRHVDRLTDALAADGHEVHVLTREAPGLPLHETIGPIHVHRVPEYPPQVPFSDLIPWVLQFNLGLVEAGVKLLHSRQFDVIHAHDWLVAYAASSLRDIFKVPLVATVHATEYGRHQGWLPDDMNKLIHQVEWWLTYVARRVITCSTYMHDQVQRIFELPPSKLDVVPNGVALRMDGDTDEGAAARPVRPEAPTEVPPKPQTEAPTVLFAGRLEYEKGVQTVISAAPAVLAAHPGARFLVAGTGTYEAALRAQVDEAGLGDRVTFLGFVDGERMAELYRTATVVVAPSIYEPFGIVALEAMAARVPVIVGDTGGLRELVTDGTNGLRVTPEDADALAEAICTVLARPDVAASLVRGAEAGAHGRGWRMIARRTVAVYERAIDEEAAFHAGEGVDEHPPLRLVWDASHAYRRVVDRDDDTDDSGEFGDAGGPAVADV